MHPCIVLRGALHSLSPTRPRIYDDLFSKLQNCLKQGHPSNNRVSVSLSTRKRLLTAAEIPVGAYFETLYLRRASRALKHCFLKVPYILVSLFEKFLCNPQTFINHLSFLCV